MGRELEWKFAATEDDLAKIREAFPGSIPIAMETTYYDTPTGELAARRMTLRRRYENRKSICTLKTPGENGIRGEWEVEADTIEEAIPVLCKLSNFGQIGFLIRNGVAPACGARFTRLAATLDLPECTVELALDQGQLLGGERTLPFCEVEVEYKAGSSECAHRFALDLAERYGLKPENRSKYFRAQLLAKGEK